MTMKGKHLDHTFTFLKHSQKSETHNNIFGFHLSTLFFFFINIRTISNFCVCASLEFFFTLKEKISFYYCFLEFLLLSNNHYPTPTSLDSIRQN